MKCAKCGCDLPRALDCFGPFDAEPRCFGCYMDWAVGGEEGWTECGECNGSTFAKCRNCNGSGDCVCDCCDHRHECRKCDGEGWDETKKCKECDGAGKLYNGQKAKIEQEPVQLAL